MVVYDVSSIISKNRNVSDGKLLPISHPSWRQLQPNVSDLPVLPFLVALAFQIAISHILNVVRHIERTNKEVSYQPTPTNHIMLRKISTDVIYCNVSDLPGLLLQVLLAVHCVGDDQLYLMCGQTCWKV